MATIVTVHGTFASGPEIAEPGQEKWWQKTSPFEKHILELVEAEDGPVKTAPFVWDGANSETSRRKAGKALIGTLQDLDMQGEPYTVVGHSHGGSVIGAALMESAKIKQPLTNMQRWISIGTPFIKTRKERFLFNRLGLFGKSVYVALLTGALLVMLSLNIDYGRFGEDFLAFSKELWDGGFHFAFLIAAGPFLLFYVIMRYLNGRKLHIYDRKTTKFADRTFNPRWLSLWHANDEAVQGLRSLKSMKVDVFAKEFAVAPLNLISVFILPIAVLLFASSPQMVSNVFAFSISPNHSFPPLFSPTFEGGVLNNQLIDGGDNIQANVTFLLEYFGFCIASILFGPEPVAWGIDKQTQTIFSMLIFLPVALLLVAIAITFAVDVIARGVSFVLSRLLNPVTMGQIRATAFGSDTLEDVAVDASEWPMWFGKGHPPLPDPLGPELQSYSDQAVSKAVPKFRNAVRQFTAADSKEEKSDMLSAYLTWAELIHTSYFHNEKFRKLIAYAIAQGDGFRPSPAFKSDPDYDIVAGWYREITSHKAETDAA